jgi:hypothetical protein
VREALPYESGLPDAHVLWADLAQPQGAEHVQDLKACGALVFAPLRLAPSVPSPRWLSMFFRVLPAACAYVGR